MPASPRCSRTLHSLPRSLPRSSLIKTQTFSEQLVIQIPELSRTWGSCKPCATSGSDISAWKSMRGANAVLICFLNSSWPSRSVGDNFCEWHRTGEFRNLPWLKIQKGSTIRDNCKVCAIWARERPRVYVREGSDRYPQYQRKEHIDCISASSIYV